MIQLIVRHDIVVAEHSKNKLSRYVNVIVELDTLDDLQLEFSYVRYH